MKTFRAHTSFIPESVVNSFSRETPAVVLPKTDYEIIDTNQAFGIYIKIYTSSKKTTEDNFQKIYISPEEIKKYGEVQQKLTIFDLIGILKKITFAPSCVDFNWNWEVVEVEGDYWEGIEPYAKGKTHGFLINTTFQRPDTNTGISGIGKGRRMWIEDTASETSVVMTAWICIDLIVKHEIMEAIQFKEARILNPHKTLSELAYPEILK